MLFADQVATRIAKPTAPFHFDGTVHKPSHFPAGNVCYEPGFYWQTLRFGNRCLGLRLKDLGTRARPRVEVALFAPKPLPASLVDAAVAEIAFRFDIYTPLAEFVSAFRHDALLAPILRRWGGMRMSCAYSLYEYLVVAVVLQNTTVRRSTQMLEALFQRFGTRMRFDGRELHCFWPPRTLCRASEAELRALKVGYRAKSLLRLAQALAAGEVRELDLRGADREVVRMELLRLYALVPRPFGTSWPMCFTTTTPSMLSRRGSRRFTRVSSLRRVGAGTTDPPRDQAAVGSLADVGVALPVRGFVLAAAAPGDRLA